MRLYNIRLVSWLVLAITFAAGGSLADDRCVPVVSHGAQPDFSEDCGEYDFCYSGWVVGTLNGDFLYYSMDPWFTLVDEGGEVAVSIWGNDVFVTQKGELYARERSIYDWNVDKWAATAVITGGTGSYEGATGYLVHYGDNASLEVRGEICTATGGPGPDEQARGRRR